MRQDQSSVANIRAKNCSMSSEPISVHLDCRAPCSEKAVRRAIEAVRLAAHDNYGAETGSVTPQLWYDGRECDEDSVAQIIACLKSPNSMFGSGSSHCQVMADYSPLSTEKLELGLWRFGHDDKLDMFVQIREHAKYEVVGSRERDRMEREWIEKLAEHGLVDLNHGYITELPTLNEMPRRQYQKWRKRYDELEATPSIWPQNRRCFLRIVENLKQAFDVTQVELDPRLILTEEL